MSSRELEVRPHRLATLRADPPRDMLDRQQPRRIGAAAFFRAIPGLFAQFQKIPSDFWTLDVTDDGFTLAKVACPCGETPALEVGELTECSCPRFFYFAGENVFVANSPKNEVPRWQQIARAYLQTVASS